MIPNENHDVSDVIADKLQKITFTILIIVFGLLPLFFIPLPAASLAYSKILIVLVGIALALITYSLYVLRSGGIKLRFPYAIGGLWLIFAVSLIRWGIGIIRVYPPGRSTYLGATSLNNFCTVENL